MLRVWTALVAVVVAIACAHSATNGRFADVTLVYTPAERVPALGRLGGLGTEQLLAQYPARFVARQGFDPNSAAGVDLIRKAGRLDDEEAALLAENGLVMSRRNEFHSFALAYRELYERDLPVFISADAILHAFHRSYDQLLVETERDLLAPMLGEYLTRLRSALRRADGPTRARAELDTYLTVAMSLLEDEEQSPRAGGSSRQVSACFRAARAASGSTLDIFDGRNTELSLFKPRGHYESHPELVPYFRAMSWLGQIDFRWLETGPDGQRALHRSQVEASLMARELMDARSVDLWNAIDQAVSVFVGMRDAMSPPDVDGFLREARIKRVTQLSRLDDAALVRLIERGRYGKKLIQGDLAAKHEGVGELPLNASFALFPRRYTLDSHTLHAVSADRVPDRQLPSALDVGFATLGNAFSAKLLEPELDRFGYAGSLATMRGLSDAQTNEYWRSSFYTAWLSALRALSKDEDANGPLPSAARTEAWARRVLNAQLASWSELRHDTILYAEQSFSVGVLCEFPDAYVEPYPEFFSRLAQAAELGLSVIARLRAVGSGIDSARFDGPERYFEHALDTYRRLEEIARDERQGKRLSARQLDFANEMVKIEIGPPVGCGGPTRRLNGWYKQLFYNVDVVDSDVTVADVHTSSTDGILHVAKGLPRAVIVTIDDGKGPRAFIGAAFSYFEFTRATRMADSEWRRVVGEAADEDWVAPILAHAVGEPLSPEQPDPDMRDGLGVCDIDPRTCE